jgi:hypothetical protein
MALPQKSAPDFFFTLYFSNLFTPDLSKQIAICTNANRCPLFSLNPLYSYIYTGDAEAVSISKTLAGNPTNFKNIPGGVIPEGVILSRQLVGTDVRLTLTTFNNLAPTETTVFTGQVGKVTQKFLSVDLELLSDTARLSTTARLKTSVGCMNTLGVGLCTVNRTPVITGCTGIGVSNFLISPGMTLNPSFEYEVVVGTTRYLVNKAVTTVNSISVVGLLQGVPQKIMVQKHCNRTVATCSGTYNNLSQFNGIILLPADSLVINM